MLGVCQQVAAIPMKRVAPPETRFLERDEVEQLLRRLPRDGRLALRDRALLLFLYNTGARVQEAADLRVGNLDLGEHPVVRLHGKGDKWRTCPLWRQTAELLSALLDIGRPGSRPRAPVFSARGQPLTRFGIYKIVRRHAADLDDPRTGRSVSPHVFRHTAAVHLLEAGVEVNVIRGWLGHADLRPPTAMPRSTPGRSSQLSGPSSLQVLRRDPAPTRSGAPTNRSSTGSPRSDRYVASDARTEPPIAVKTRVT